MTQISGMIRSDKTESYRKKTAINENVIEQVKNIARFSYLLRKLGKKPVDYWQFYVQENPDSTRHTAVNNVVGYAIGATSVLVDDASVFGVNQRIWNISTDDYTTVTAIDAGTNTLTVDALIAAWVDNDVLVGLAQGVPEGGTIQNMPFHELSTAYNYTQQIVRTIPISWREQIAPKYGPDELALRRKQAFNLFYEDIELQLLFGDLKTKSGSDGTVTTYTAGVENVVTTQSLAAAAGSVTESAFVGFLQDLAYYGSQEFILLDGGPLMSQIATYAMNDRVVENKTLTGMLGTKVTMYESTFGRVNFVYHPLMAKVYSKLTTPTYKAFLIPMQDAGLAIYRDQMHLSDISDNDTTANTEAWFIDCGLWYSREPSWGVITGIQ